MTMAMQSFFLVTVCCVALGRVGLQVSAEQSLQGQLLKMLASLTDQPDIDTRDVIPSVPGGNQEALQALYTRIERIDGATTSIYGTSPDRIVEVMAQAVTAVGQVYFSSHNCALNAFCELYLGSIKHTVENEMDPAHPTSLYNAVRNEFGAEVPEGDVTAIVNHMFSEVLNTVSGALNHLGMMSDEEEFFRTTTRAVHDVIQGGTLDVTLATVVKAAFSYLGQLQVSTEDDCDPLDIDILISIGLDVMNHFIAISDSMTFPSTTMSEDLQLAVWQFIMNQHYNHPQSPMRVFEILFASMDEDFDVDQFYQMFINHLSFEYFNSVIIHDIDASLADQIMTQVENNHWHLDAHLAIGQLERSPRLQYMSSAFHMALSRLSAPCPQVLLAKTVIGFTSFAYGLKTHEDDTGDHHWQTIESVAMCMGLGHSVNHMYKTFNSKHLQRNNGSRLHMDKVYSKCMITDWYRHTMMYNEEVTDESDEPIDYHSLWTLPYILPAVITRRVMDSIIHVLDTLGDDSCWVFDAINEEIEWRPDNANNNLHDVTTMVLTSFLEQMSYNTCQEEEEILQQLDSALTQAIESLNAPLTPAEVLDAFYSTWYYIPPGFTPDVLQQTLDCLTQATDVTADMRFALYYARAIIQETRMEDKHRSLARWIAEVIDGATQTMISSVGTDQIIRNHETALDEQYNGYRPTDMLLDIFRRLVSAMERHGMYLDDFYDVLRVTLDDISIQQTDSDTADYKKRPESSKKSKSKSKSKRTMKESSTGQSWIGKMMGKWNMK